MRKILIGLVFCFASIGVSASENCKEIYDLSYKIMKMRQWNAPIVEQMAVLDKMTETGSRSKEDAYVKLLKKIVISAYKEPRFETEEYQEKAAKDFANSWATECYTLQ